MTEQEHAKTMAKAALDALYRVMQSEHEDAAVRVAAAKEILARGLGHYVTPSEVRESLVEALRAMGDDDDEDAT